MKIKSVILENFRAYRLKQIIPISALTAFIGRNDAGKSSILEALDIFFEGGTIKIESADASKNGNPKCVRIGVVFNGLPAQLILDSKSPTTLAAEHLLNDEGDLEIHKIFDCSIATPKAKVFASAFHPTEQGAADVLQKLQKDLKAIVKAKELETKCNLTENPSMRHAVYGSFVDLKLKLSEVPLNEDNGKAIWKALQEYLPHYALFQSDRPSSDQDPEVQNPMKIAVEQALDQLTSDLDTISDEVRKKAEETANRTLAKLQANYPNLANTLKPNFRKPAWKSIFKLDLEADDGIPLNKRGSGVRRLVLLSFFQAEAEKKRAMEDGTPSRCVVYAVEEPETSQHPDSQEQIIRVLRDLANAGDQVLLTTHVPALAGLVPLSSLQYVDRDPDTHEARVRQGTPTVYDEIAAGLGVLPDPVRGPGLKVAVLVEGKNDIDALRSMAAVLTAAGEVTNYDESKIFWTIGGGDALKDWVERRYLDRLRLPQVIIRDSDRSAAALPLSPTMAQWLQDTNALPNVTAFITNKRNMDNYVHADVIDRLTNGQVIMPADFDWDYHRTAETLSQCLTAAMQNGLSFHPDDHNGIHIVGSNKGSCKKIISAYFMRHMTADELRQRATYTIDGGRSQAHEIHEWFEAITDHLA